MSQSMFDKANDDIVIGQPIDLTDNKIYLDVYHHINVAIGGYIPDMFDPNVECDYHDDVYYDDFEYDRYSKDDYHNACTIYNLQFLRRLPWSADDRSLKAWQVSDNIKMIDYDVDDTGKVVSVTIEIVFHNATQVRVLRVKASNAWCIWLDDWYNGESKFRPKLTLPTEIAWRCQLVSIVSRSIQRYLDMLASIKTQEEYYLQDVAVNSYKTDKGYYVDEFSFIGTQKSMLGY